MSLLKDQNIFPLVIILLVFITFTLEYVLILLAENWSLRKDQSEAYCFCIALYNSENVLQRSFWGANFWREIVHSTKKYHISVLQAKTILATMASSKTSWQLKLQWKSPTWMFGHCHIVFLFVVVVGQHGPQSVLISWYYNSGFSKWKTQRKFSRSQLQVREWKKLGPKCSSVATLKMPLLDQN